MYACTCTVHECIRVCQMLRDVTYTYVYIILYLSNLLFLKFKFAVFNRHCYYID